MPPRRKRKAATREETKLKKQKDECLTRCTLKVFIRLAGLEEATSGLLLSVFLLKIPSM